MPRLSSSIEPDHNTLSPALAMHKATAGIVRYTVCKIISHKALALITKIGPDHYLNVFHRLIPFHF